MEFSLFLKDTLYRFKVEPQDTNHDDVNDAVVIEVEEDGDDYIIVVKLEVSHNERLDYELPGEQYDVDVFGPDEQRVLEVVGIHDITTHFILDELITKETLELNHDDSDFIEFFDSVEEYDQKEYHRQVEPHKLKFNVTLVSKE